MSLFIDVISPTLPVLARMEARGIPLDVPMRDRLRKEAEDRLAELEGLIRQAVGGYHSRRRERVQVVLEDLERQRALFDGSPRDERRKALTKRIQKARTRLEQIKDQFDIENDNHWRSYIYDPQVGLGLPVTHKTDSGLPSVDKEAIRALCIAHPQHTTLQNRRETQDLAVRLRNRLAVEPDRAGRVHYAYSLHRAPGRLTSGDDYIEEDKARESDGGGQNLTERDLRMWIAEPGFSLVKWDMSQVEARVQAHFAKDIKMLTAFKNGWDVHSMAAGALYGINYIPGTPKSEDPTRKKKIWFAGKMADVREAGKRWRHRKNYGGMPPNAATMFGITKQESFRLDRVDDEMWPAMKKFREEELARAAEEGKLVNPFGRVAWFPRKKTAKGWVVADRETALSSRPQTTVSDMCKVLLVKLDLLIGTFVGGELLATTHDDFLAMIPTWQVPQYLKESKPIVERKWPELGEVEGFGLFYCPCDAYVGKNAGDYDELENPEGLREMRVEEVAA